MKDPEGVLRRLEVELRRRLASYDSSEIVAKFATGSAATVQLAVARRLQAETRSLLRYFEIGAVPMELVKVNIYSHPDWDTKLILEATGRDREQAEENLGDTGDPSKLTVEEGELTRNVLESLPEWDG